MFQACFKEVSGKFHLHFKGFSRMFEVCFTSVSRVFQRSYKQGSRSFQGGFNEVSRVFLWNIKGVRLFIDIIYFLRLRVVLSFDSLFQSGYKEFFGSFKYVSKGFQGSFKIMFSVFKDISSCMALIVAIWAEGGLVNFLWIRFESHSNSFRCT